MCCGLTLTRLHLTSHNSFVPVGRHWLSAGVAQLSSSIAPTRLTFFSTHNAVLAFPVT